MTRLAIDDDHRWQVPLSQNNSHDRTPTQGDTPTGWECYTNLVRGPSGEVNLTAQTHEVKIVVRLAIRAIMANLCFVDFYPSSATRAAWHAKALTSAARTLQNGATQKKNERVAHHYKMVRERLKTDEDYVPVLGKIVCRLTSAQKALLIIISSTAASLFFGTTSNRVPSKLLSPISSFALAVLTRWNGS